MILRRSIENDYYTGRAWSGDLDKLVKLTGIEDRYLIEASLFNVDEPEKFILFLPGGGISLGKERFFGWQNKLRDLGIGSMSLDFPGQGKSSQDITKSSLSERIDITVDVLRWLSDFLKKDTHIYLYGVSMGGFVVSKSLMELEDKVEGVILQSPACYSEKAVSINFGKSFSEEIKRNDSWKETKVFNDIKKFGKKILYIYSSEDKIIPNEINSKFIEILSMKNNIEILSLNGAEHGILDNQDINKKYKDLVFETLLSFIK